MPDPLPARTDHASATGLPQNVTENGVFHESRKAAAWGAALVANGTPEDLTRAEHALGAVLEAQERDPDDPHRGNFYWMLEDNFVQDLNAVQFNLEHLIPMMLRHAERLPDTLRKRILAAIALGLEEVARLDVALAYTNICLLDIVNTSLGGELLGDADVAERGIRKLEAWSDFTAANGAVFEYNSPTYANVGVRALGRLAALTGRASTRVLARTALARLGLSAALHLHRATGRWTGPHSRIYHPSLLCETPPETELFASWLGEGLLPEWLGSVLDTLPDRFEVTETASAERGYSLTTYQTPAFALGVSSREYSGQSDVMTLHYARPGAERPGVMYTRFLKDDKWLGDFYHATDRTRSRNLIEEGQFYGVQESARALGLYSFADPGSVHSAKTCVIWQDVDEIESLWVGETRVEALPAAVPPGEVVSVVSGEVYSAVWPLERSMLGRDAPTRLVERGGDLVLELYSYLGPEKRFWDLGWPGFFYQGRPYTGVYVEVAARSAYRDAPAFARAIRSGTLTDRAEAPYTYGGAGERVKTLAYARDGATLGLEVDLMTWTLRRRWTGEGDLGWPALESLVARQNATGFVEVNGASLRCRAAPAWLYADSAQDLFVAAYHGAEPGALELRVPGGSVRVERMGHGTLVWHRGEVSIDALEADGVTTTKETP